MSRRVEHGAAKRGHRAPRYADRSGFTLIEALVAFTVMATVLGVLYRGVVQTRAGAAVFAARTQEEVVARSLLAEFRARRDLRDGSYSGSRDGRRWTLKASAMDLSEQLPKGEPPGGAAPPADRPGGPAKPEAKKPLWVAQRLVLKVATGARPLETEAVHIVKLPPPADEATR